MLPTRDSGCKGTHISTNRKVLPKENHLGLTFVNLYEFPRLFAYWFVICVFVNIIPNYYWLWCGFFNRLIISVIQSTLEHVLNRLGKYAIYRRYLIHIPALFILNTEPL